MSQYTTGEMAKLCGVSVRTVQFYDEKDLLKPAELTEGGRRLYSEDDLKKFQMICLFKSLGLSLESIAGVMSSKHPGNVLGLLLDEQLKQLDTEMEEMERQRRAIEVVKENIRSTQAISVKSIQDIEQIMNAKKNLKKVHGWMLVVGIIMDLIQIGTLLLWIFKGIWWPFAAGMPLVILSAILMVRMYYKNTAYICPECGTVFRPKLKQFFFANHTPKTRKLTCPNCGFHGYCVETYADENTKIMQA